LINCAVIRDFKSSARKINAESRQLFSRFDIRVIRWASPNLAAKLRCLL
jgi:hypothetical protein